MKEKINSESISLITILILVIFINWHIKIIAIYNIFLLLIPIDVFLMNMGVVVIALLIRREIKLIRAR